MERGQLDLNDDHDERLGRNEEMMYSGVQRQSFQKFKCYNSDVSKSIDKMQHSFIKDSIAKDGKFVREFHQSAAKPAPEP